MTLHSPMFKRSARQVNRTLLENEILPNVFKPARYVGLEQGAYRKPFDKAAATMAVVFPDLYEIGVSNYGLKLLYSLVNQLPTYMCDRAYAPAPDMKEKLAQFDFPLYGVESLVPLKNFDMLAFTLQYELNYTTILGVLEASKIPFRSVERQQLSYEISCLNSLDMSSPSPEGIELGGKDAEQGYPLLIAGGPGSGNPMPLAPFFDAFIIGDGEEVLVEILDTISQGKKHRWDKPTLLDKLAELQGVYIPDVTDRAEKRIVDIAEHPVDIAPLIPAIQAVHDRVVVEARRGCDRMCRFCQPCFINLPVREQSIEQVKKSALSEIEKTGYEECSLLSLSIADYSYFKPLILEVTEALEEEGISLSLPSQRADRFSIDVAEAVQRVRKSTLTFAPEAGTKRLRDVINKNLTDEEILNAVTSAYKAGWNKVKLYFIIGLPTETLDDLDGIYHTVQMLRDACAAIKRDPALSIRSHLDINVTLSNFVPKPHTPFQWFPQDTMEMLNAKIRYLKDKFRGIRGVKLNFTDPEISKLEAVISKGGPELADILELAYRKGAYLDAWDDVDNFKKWFDALTELGPTLGLGDYESYTRERCVEPDEPLPWDPIDVGLNKSWLKAEYEKAKAEAATVPCFEACSTCGVCANYSTWPKFTDTPANLEKYSKNVPGITGLSLETSPRNKVKSDPWLPSSGMRVNRRRHLEPVAKVRLKLEKQGKLKFISHLDWIRLIYRAVSRAKIPMAYSQGFNPKPKIAFSPALPLFSESLGEYVDLELTENVSNNKTDIQDRLNAYLPEGGRVLSVETIPLHSKSIDKSIQSVSYRGTPWLPGQTDDPFGGSSFEQATCQAALKEYTGDNRLQVLAADLQHRLAAKIGQPIGQSLGSEPQHNPLTDPVNQTPTSLEPTDCNKSFSLTPHLEDLRLLQDCSIEFRIRRHPVLRSINPSDTQDDAGQISGQQLPSIKPAWVLNSIDSNLRWSLIRTDIELDSSQS